MMQGQEKTLTQSQMEGDHKAELLQQFVVSLRSFMALAWHFDGEIWCFQSYLNSSRL